MDQHQQASNASRVQRMGRVHHTLTSQFPIDADTPILVICDKEHSLQWINAARVCGMTREIKTMTLLAVEKQIDTIVLQKQVVVVDEQRLSDRARLREVTQAFGRSKVNHRFFMTFDPTEVEKPR